jgi:formylmethanofuran dehydrogenase subunit E
MKELKEDLSAHDMKEFHEWRANLNMTSDFAIQAEYINQLLYDKARTLQCGECGRDVFDTDAERLDGSQVCKPCYQQYAPVTELRDRAEANKADEARDV